MEKLLPLLIGIAFFAFKTYSNYKEEQEKAKKRRAHVQPNTAAQQVPHDKQTYAQGKQMRAEQAKIEPTIKEAPVAYKSAFNEVERAKVERLARMKKEDDKKIHKLQVEREREIEPEFNLRQAIIQSVILERPYQ